MLLFNSINLKGRTRAGGRKGKKSSSHCFTPSQGWVKLKPEGRNTSWVSQIGGRCLSAWAVCYYLRKLDQNLSRWDLNQHSRMEYSHVKRCHSAHPGNTLRMWLTFK